MSSRPRHPGSAITDWHLWTEVKRTVEPLRPDAELDNTPLPLPEPATASGAASARTRPARPARRQAPVRSPETSPPGLEPRLRRRLERGTVAIDATLDLHGMRQIEARAALERFIGARAARGDRTVLVITGKGLARTDDMRVIDRGVLRVMLPVWLAEPGLRNLVSGWEAAARGHGGEGALYVRLRRAARR